MTCGNAAHRGDPQDYCAACAREAEAELTLLGDRYQRLLNDQSAESRRTRAAARRDAQDHMRAFAYLILPGLLNELMHNVRPALYRATQVDPAMGRRQMDRSRLLALKNEAGSALRAWNERTSMERLPADFAADPREAEITRLRAIIETAGKRLHDEAGTTFDGFNPCQCAGCELIRDMDAEGVVLAGGEVEP